MVSVQLKEITEQFFEKGKLDENFVMEATEKTLGGKCYRGTKDDDIKRHIDFFWESPKKGLLGIDVKGLNKSKRSDKEFDDSIHWIEARNVKGNKGWIYGEADYIAFRTLKNILFVKPSKLIEIYEQKVKSKEYVTSTPKDCYMPYKRVFWGRDDITFKMPNEDLVKITDFSIEYK